MKVYSYTCSANDLAEQDFVPYRICSQKVCLRNRADIHVILGIAR